MRQIKVATQKKIWEPVKYYFADLVYNGVHPSPPSFRDQLFAEKQVTD